MEVIQIQYVPVPETALIRDEFGRKLLKIAFCLEVANCFQEQNDLELSNDGKFKPNEKLQPGLEWKFDDDTRIVTYGENSITFRGELQYQLLKIAQKNETMNVRDVWKEVWKDSLPEWRTVRDCARHLNSKLTEAGIPYEIKADSCFVNFLENF